MGAMLYSLVTVYELGLARVSPRPVQLSLDAISGVVLAASPWVFGFADDIWWPHLILGLLEIGAGLTTRTRPEGLTLPPPARS